MTKKSPRRAKLQVHSSGITRYIEVPAKEAAALHGYLLRHGVPALPPAPCSSDVDTIGLERGLETNLIQKLLNGWC
jgi:hypothetical protein